MRKVLNLRRGWLFVCAAVVLVFAYLAVDLPQKAQEKSSAAQPFAAYNKFSRRDALTDEIRSSSKELVRVEINNDAERTAIARSGSVVQDFGSFAIVAKTKGSVLPVSGAESRRIAGKVYLPGASFDPISSLPAETVPEGVNSLSEEKGYYVVQFGGIPTDEWLNSVRDAGVEILQYVPDQAFFVYGDGAAISRVASHSRVRWVGRYASEQRLPKLLRDQLDAEKGKAALRSNISRLDVSAAGTAIFDVAVFARADLKDAASRIASISGGTVRNLVRLPNNFFNIVRVEVPLDKVSELANIPDVVRIDAWSRPRKEDERAAQIVAGNYTSTTELARPGYDPFMLFGVEGSNVTVSVVDDGVGIPGDGGFYITSLNAVKGPLRGTDGSASGHGHLNASIIAGDSPFSALDPLGYNYGRGIAPKANIIDIPLLRAGYPLSDANAYNDTVSTAGPNGVFGSISNNSWGADTNGNVYDAFTAQFDGFVRDASFAPSVNPLTIIFSAGNEAERVGPLSLTRPKAAKNIITVGASENLRSDLYGAKADNIDDLASYSSRGNTADGRIKPDIIAPGSAITGGRSGSDVLFGNIDGASARWSVGTSHAAPQVAGAAALFTQYFKIINSGNNPSPAMVKAAILLSGQEMNGANANTSTVPNGNEGWGRINMKYVIDRAALVKQVDQSVQLFNVGDTYTLNGSVNDPSRPVRVALVWTDPPAVGDPALVNNLDLTVTIGSNTYRGNVFSGGTSVTGGSYDTLNNVEQVWLPAGIPSGTPYSITVRATNVPGDGILGNGDSTDQDFALVAYNFNESAPAAFYSIEGQLVSQSGRGVSKAVVTLTGQDGVPRMTITNPFGYFRFSNVAGPQTYTVAISAKRNAFNPQNLFVGSNITSLVITSVQGGP